MPAVALNEVLLPWQITLLPVMVQTGNGFTVNTLVQVLWHPLASVIVTVYVPAAEIVPVLWVVAVNPPGPIHAYEVMPAVALHVVVLPAHTALLPPVIAQIGSGFTVAITSTLLLSQVIEA